MGIEKITELDWTGEEDMFGLIYHELGHAYQMQHGYLCEKYENNEEGFIMQLFYEGVAMYFEQVLVGNENFFHQDKGGWLDFLRLHSDELKKDFYLDIKRMDSLTQRYFGDWARWNGVGDAGYYLGSEFLRFILRHYDFNTLISFRLPKVKELFEKFILE